VLIRVRVMLDDEDRKDATTERARAKSVNGLETKRAEKSISHEDSDLRCGVLWDVLSNGDEERWRPGATSR